MQAEDAAAAAAAEPGDTQPCTAHWQLRGHDSAREGCSILGQNGRNVTPNSTETLSI